MRMSLVFLAGMLACQHAPPPAPGARDPLRDDLVALAADDMEGRGIGTKGVERAAEYVAARFREAGLQPVFQEFTVSTGAKAGPGTRLAFAGAPLDVVPFSFSDDGQAKAGAVFCGYGISAPELSYDDYAGVDVKGKVAVVFEHEPREHDAQSPFRKPQASRYRELRYKAMNARDHGAAGLLVLPDAAAHPGRATPPPALSGGARSASAGILAAGAGLAAAKALLGDAGALQRGIDDALKPASRALEGEVELHVELVRETAPARNVVAVARGTDAALAEEALVIGAHYDHLGFGGESSLAPDSHEVHNGADDNASGAAALLDLARRLAGKTRRTLVFVAFSGEEMGLLGSSHYVKNATHPLERTVGMINLDMVGRLRDGRVIVHGADTGEGFRELVERESKALGLNAAPGGDGYGPSDHTSFYAAQKPVLFFFTGAHTDYHRPSDDAQKIDFAGLARVTGLVERVARALADADRAPALAKAPPPGSPHGAAGPGRSGGGYGPYLGTIPDFAERTEPGVLLSGVRPGSPAEKAGIRAGDVLVKLGEQEIRNLQEMTYALRAHRAGDTVEIVVLRGNERVTMKTTLEERR